MNSYRIPFNKPFIAGKELEYLNQAVENGQLAGGGKFTKLCNEWLEKELSCRRALLTQSGTASLEMAAILLDLHPGDEVIMPSYTFVSTANAFVLRGAVPVFVDIRTDTLNIDEKKISAAITDKTKAIVPVHYAGKSCDMDTILEISRGNSIYIIEDAAQALLSKYKNKYLGSMGDVGCISFHETKNIISGEGGALLVNAPELIDRAEIIWNKGTNRKQFVNGAVEKYTWVDIGSSFLPSELTAAFLMAQLEQSEGIIKRRCVICDRYNDGLRELEQKGVFIRGQHCCDRESNGHMYYIILQSGEVRTKLINYLRDKGILAVFHYVPLHSSPAGLKYGRVSQSMNVTNDISSRLLRLPLYYQMTNTDVDTVIECIYDYFRKGKSQ